MGDFLLAVVTPERWEYKLAERWRVRDRISKCCQLERDATALLDIFSALLGLRLARAMILIDAVDKFGAARVSCFEMGNVGFDGWRD